MSETVLKHKTRRVQRVSEVGVATLRWCSTHHETVWEYQDGSQRCTYDLIVESNNDHDVVNGPWEKTP